jgi:hypothetical protein
MKFGRLIAPTVCLCSALFAASANAQTNDTYLYIVDGVSGANVAAGANPAYPIDILINGQFCIVQGASFGEVKGPFTAPAGSFSFKVSVANTGYPCSNPSLYEVTTNLAAGQTNFGVITTAAYGHLYAELIPADFSAIPAGQSRVVIANYTDKSLTASLTATSNNQTNSLSYIAPGSYQTAAAPSGGYTGAIYVAGTQTEVLGPISANLESRNFSLYVLTGFVANNSVQLIGPKTIKNVF